MKMKRNRILLIASTCLLCLFSITALAGKPRGGSGGNSGAAAYAIVPFMPPGFAATSSWVNDLNEVGQVVGGILLPNGTTQAVHVDMTTGEYTILSGGSNASPTGVNNLDQIVGDIGGQAAFWSSPSAEPVLLPPLSGNTASWTRRINDTGVVVGGSSNSAPPSMAVVWSVTVDGAGTVQVDGPRPLVPIAGDMESSAMDISECVGGICRVVGSSQSDDDYLAVVWPVSINGDNSIAATSLPQTIGTLGQTNPSTSQGYGINNLGDTCGISDRTPFVALYGDQPVPLTVPRNTAVGYALGINDFDEIVGEATPQLKRNQTTPSQPQAYLWRDNQPIELLKQIDLNSGWDSLWGAHRINNAGVIAGSGKLGGTSLGFLMIPNQP